MKIMEPRFISSSLQITWGLLFPKTAFRTPLQKAMEKKSPGTVKKYLRDNEKIEMQKVIVRMLIPEQYRTMEKSSDITDVEKTQISRYFNCSDNNFGKKRYEAVKDHILAEGNSGNYDFNSLPFIKDLKENLSDIFSLFSPGFQKTYKEDVEELILLFDKDPLLKAFKESLLKADFYSRMACLTAIAATWYCWCNSEKDVLEKLCSYIVPFQTEAEKSDWLSSHREQRKAFAAKRFHEAKDYLENKDYDQAGDIFAQIIEKKEADSSILGKACLSLAVCCKEHLYQYNKTAAELLQSAADYGNKDAQDLIKKEKAGHKENSSPFPLLCPISETHGTARIIYNSKNKYTNEFFKSIPKEMQHQDDLQDKLIFADSPKKLVQYICSDEDCRYLLFDHSQEKNFQDLLFILDEISQKKPLSSDFSQAALRWYKISVYIRVSEENYAPLIDTALKRLNDFIIQIYIIDDCKWSAQYLLAQHPLFELIEALPGRHLQNKAQPVNINFTIISDGNTELTRRLIQEAFWFGCFYYSAITLKINLISPDTKRIESELRFDCPDMFSKLPDSAAASKVQVLPSNTSGTVDSVFSPEVLGRLNELAKAPNSYHYYVINIGDDVKNMNYGIKIREWNIRNLIESGTEPQINELPVIAFYCENSNIAHLARHTVVQTIDQGNSWYNNYRLVPFGVLRDRYSWEKIDGGYFEKLAEAVHLQYDGAKPSDPQETRLGKLKDYFLRSYNRDSSMAVALSMPYRLFQTTYKDQRILSESSLFSTDAMEDRIKTAAGNFKKAISDSAYGQETKQNLLCYEHSRWLRWIISRGWKHAAPEHVLTYMNAGNQKHQLFIARMHGCICSLDNLQKLSNEMYQYVEKNPSSENWERYAEKKEGHSKFTAKDFKSIDKRSIEDTGEILTTAVLDGLFRNSESEKEL